MAFTGEENNSNGLIGGNIPAGNSCPFLSECSLRNERCPSAENIKTNDFSCAAARMFSTCKTNKQGPNTILGRVLHNCIVKK
jgi:hypothetical protein